jgi:hypothetical protein
MALTIEEYAWECAVRTEGAVRRAIESLACDCGCEQNCGALQYFEMDEKPNRHGRYYIHSPHGTIGYLFLHEGEPPAIPDSLAEEAHA